MIGKREIGLLIILGLIVYGFFFYKVIWVKALPDIEDRKQKIEIAQNELDALEQDYANIENLKRSLETKTVQNERLEEYLMNESNVSDNIEFVDKLSKLFDNKIINTGISPPVQLVVQESDNKYYEFKISFDALMTYDEAKDLADYLEGGTRKIKITDFELEPGKSSQQITQPNDTQGTNTQDSSPKLSLKMTINLYSLNLGSLDKVYEYSRQKFNTYYEGDGVFFPSTINNGIGTNPNNNTGGSNISSRDNGGNSGSSNINVAASYDIKIKMESFGVGGPNFGVYNAKNNKAISFKTKITPEVKLYFEEDSLKIDVYGNEGIHSQILGNVPDKDSINLNVVTDISQYAPEDKGLGLDIQIFNKTGKRINLSVSDKMKIAKISDRNGNIISGNNNTEKVFIV